MTELIEKLWPRQKTDELAARSEHYERGNAILFAEEVLSEAVPIIRADERAKYKPPQDHPWNWKGDGEDHLESLACPVLIEAKDLRQFRAEAIKDIQEKWDKLCRHDAWAGKSDREIIRQFDQYIQRLTLPQRLNEKFPLEKELKEE